MIRFHLKFRLRNYLFYTAVTTKSIKIKHIDDKLARYYISDEFKDCVDYRPQNTDSQKRFLNKEADYEKVFPDIHSADGYDHKTGVVQSCHC